MRKNMLFFYCIISLLGIAHGSPYYYREDKHHSEHHKEYSYGNSQPSLSAYESFPQKYTESSHFSTQVTPQRHYKLETSPSFSSGFDQQLEGFHQSEFQSTGIQSGRISPLLPGQSINVQGVKPGTYVIKQVKVYRQPTTYTGFYGTSHFDGKGMETGQQHENFYGSQQEENLNSQKGQYVKQVQTSLYHQVLPAITKDERLFGQKHTSEDFSQYGQKQLRSQEEDSLYMTHKVDLIPQRGDIDIGQGQDLRTQHSQIVQTLEKQPLDGKNKGYKYYEKRVTTYGSPEKESSAYKNTYVKHTQIHGTTAFGGKDLEKYQDIPLGPTIVKKTNEFDNTHAGTKQELKHVMYSQKAVNLDKIRPQTFYNNPILIPHAHQGQQIYSGSVEHGQHEESLNEQQSLDLGHLVTGSLELGQQPEMISGQLLETSPFKIGGQKESLNKKQVLAWERHINTSIVEEKKSRQETAHKPIEHHIKTEHLEIAHSTNNKPHTIVKENMTRTVIVGHNIPSKIKTDFFEIGQKEEHVGRLENINLGTGQHEENMGQLEFSSFGSDQHKEPIGQNIKTGFFEIGQKEEHVGQLENFNLETGQHEENMGQLESSVFESGQREEQMGSLETSALGTGQQEKMGKFKTGILGKSQHEENVGQLETGILGIGQHEEHIDQLEISAVGKDQHEQNVGQLETGILGIGQHEEHMDQLEISAVEKGQQEENVGQLETGILGIGQHEERIDQLKISAVGKGQHEENVGQLETVILGMGQHEEHMDQFQKTGEKTETLYHNKKQIVIPDKDNFDLGQKEETSFDFQLNKNSFPSKLITVPTQPENYNEHTSFVKTYKQHESHYKELKQNSNSKQKDHPEYYQKHDSTSRRNDQESINAHKNIDYIKLQQKTEELAKLLGFDDISKQRSSQDSKEDKYVKKNIERTSTSELQTTEIKGHSILNNHDLERGSLIPNKKIESWKTHKEYSIKYPPSSRDLYSKKQTKLHHENQGYENQQMSHNYGFQHSLHYGGYGQDYSMNSREGTYFNDQPIQRTHTSGSQFSFSSSSGSSQDRQKVIGDFLKELDKDIALTNHQHQQQGSYTGVTYSRPVESGVTYYSQRTVSTHSNSSYSSGKTPTGENTGKAWYQRIGDSIGSGYNQAKQKAQEIVKTVKQSVGYSSS